MCIRRSMCLHEIKSVEDVFAGLKGTGRPSQISYWVHENSRGCGVVVVIVALLRLWPFRDEVEQRC